MATLPEHENVEDFSKFLNGLGGRVVVLLMSCVTALFSGVAMSAVQQILENQKASMAAIAELQKNAAIYDANRFTSSDWKDASLQINERFHGIDVRVTKSEESLKKIEESLLRIEHKLVQ